MTLREFLAGEFIDIIEWIDESGDTMAWRFSRPGNEIKNGAQLIVRPAQLAIFVDQGHLADVFRPGRHTLTTANLPLLSTLRGWKYGFDSPFKADVLFVNTKQFTGQKWGTSNPVIVSDASLGPVRLRAYGTYAVHVTDPAKFVRELVGTNSMFTVEQISEQLRDLVVAKVSSVLASGRISILDLAAKYARGGRSRARAGRADVSAVRAGDLAAHHRERLASAGSRGDARSENAHEHARRSRPICASCRAPTRFVRRRETRAAAPPLASALAWAPLSGSARLLILR